MEYIRNLSLPSTKELGEKTFKNIAAMKAFLFECGFVEDDLMVTPEGDLQFDDECHYSDYFPISFNEVDPDVQGNIRFCRRAVELFDQVIING